MSKLDILCFGAHPDDVEIGMGATISKYSTLGKKIGICDLTTANLSSNGNVELRKREAMQASEILGLHKRIILDMPDRGLLMNDSYIKEIVRIIRTYEPEIIFVPYMIDRHPDHGNCARLVEEAFFSAGIKKYDESFGLKAHKAKNLFYYMINGFYEPDFVVDVTTYIDKKVQALQAYKSQFVKEEGGQETPLTDGYIDAVLAREKLFGKQVDVAYAEGFKTRRPVIMDKDLFGVSEY